MNLRLRSINRPKVEQDYKVYTENQIKLDNACYALFGEILDDENELRESYNYQEELLMLKKAIEIKMFNGDELSWDEFSYCYKRIAFLQSQKYFNSCGKHPTFDVMFIDICKRLGCSLPYKVIAHIKRLSAKDTIPKIEAEIKRLTSTLEENTKWLDNKVPEPTVPDITGLYGYAGGYTSASGSYANA